MRGVASDFQKILYPASLFPALLFEDGQAQIRMIGVLNSLYASSVVFPALAIARRLFDKPQPVIASMVFAVIIPDLMYSMTFMSESVFLPLSLWMVYLCWRAFQAKGKRELVLAACAGVLCYVVYLCKEVAWMYLIAYVGWQLLAAFRKRRTWKRCFACIAVFVGCFLALFGIFKLTLFAGLFNSYSQFSFDILLSPYTVLFGAYSVVTDGLYFIIGFGVFPVIYVACTYRDMSREQRDLVFFCLISLLIGLAVVVFTISMREDVGHEALRQHLRYVAPLSLPLLMMFIQQMWTFDPRALVQSARRRDVLVAVTVAFCALVAGFFGTANLSQGFDYAQFHFMRWLLAEIKPLDQSFFSGWDGTMSAIDATDGDLLAINAANWICRAGVILFTIAGMLALMNSNKKVRHGSGITICVIIALAMIANSAAMYLYNKKAYTVEESKITEICEISDQLSQHFGSGKVIVLMDEANTGPNNLIDTYLQDGAGNYEYLTVDAFNDLLENRTEALASAADDSLRVPVDDLVYGSIDYVLLNTNQHPKLYGLTVQQIGGAPEKSGTFILYQVL